MAQHSPNVFKSEQWLLRLACTCSRYPPWSGGMWDVGFLSRPTFWILWLSMSSSLLKREIVLLIPHGICYVSDVLSTSNLCVCSARVVWVIVPQHCWRSMAGKGERVDCPIRSYPTCLFALLFGSLISLYGSLYSPCDLALTLNIKHDFTYLHFDGGDIKC